jgi:hypothetical protein
MPYSPTRNSLVFGQTFIREFTEQPVLTIGSDTWSRHDLAAMGVVQTKACSILGSIAKKLGVRSLKEMFEHTSPYTFAEHPAGVTTMYVFFAACYDRDLDASKWYQAGEKGAITSFVTLKHRELKARAEQRKEQRQRERRTRRAKHERAVRPILERSAAQ